MDLERARAGLLAERDAASARLAALDTDLAEVVAASSGSNLDDEHDPEGATVAFEREQLAALRRDARRRIDEIDDALSRIAAGTYGTCERCGAPIGDERLAARLSARHCVTCAARTK
jgi:RNA polymerase-binding transcription factor DksA